MGHRGSKVRSTGPRKRIWRLSFLVLLWSAGLFNCVLWGLGQPSGPANLSRRLDDCQTYQVRPFPGSGSFASDFIEAFAEDPAASSARSGVLWGLTADLSSLVPASQRAMFISRSDDGGRSWRSVARLGPAYFDADIGEGERNGLAVYPRGTDFVVTTQRGAFQVIPRKNGLDPVVKAIAGPRVPRPDPEITIPKHEGDPVTANVVKITRDGRRLIVGYGYFDLNPRILTYRRTKGGAWTEDKPLPPLPTDMDLLSMEFGGTSLYVGTGDQAFRLKPRATQWTPIDGVGDDSAIQGISTVGGPHLAACWGVYQPIDANTVERVIHASFLIHRNEDETGPNIRAFSVEVDPERPAHEVVTSLTGAYVSGDYGKSWQRLHDLPEGEFRTAHFNSRDGTVIVSGIFGTFVASPFSPACGARLQRRRPRELGQR